MIRASIASAPVGRNFLLMDQGNPASTLFERPLSLMILKECCERSGYSFEEIDTFSGYLAEVSDGRKRFLAGAGKVPCYPLNEAAPFAVARDKAHTYCLLEKYGFGIPQTSHFFVTEEYRSLRPQGREISHALRFAEEIGYPVFVKPNLGSFARGAGLAYTPEDLLYHLVRIGRRDYSAIVQEFLSFPEYRLFVLDGEVKFAYRKKRPTILGDGRSTIQELAAAVGWPMPDGAQASANPFLESQLAAAGLAFSSVLEAGTEIEISAVANLAAGGVINEFFETVEPKVRAWAEKLSATTMLRVFAVDLFASKSFSDPDSFLILDVNGTPTLTSVYSSGRTELVLDIWREILNKYFHHAA